ncbi:MAG: hypothetical protein QXJ64_03545, partial [Thermosphaera sp.]
NGTDAWGRRVYYNVSDGSYLDHSESTHVIILADLLHVYPLNVKLVVYVIRRPGTILIPPTPPQNLTYSYPQFEYRPPVISEPNVYDAYGIFSFTLYLVVFILCMKMGVSTVRVLFVFSAVIMVIGALLNHNLVIVVSAIIFTFSLSYEIYVRWKASGYP